MILHPPSLYSSAPSFTSEHSFSVLFSYSPFSYAICYFSNNECNECVKVRNERRKDRKEKKGGRTGDRAGEREREREEKSICCWLPRLNSCPCRQHTHSLSLFNVAPRSPATRSMTSLLSVVNCWHSCSSFCQCTRRPKNKTLVQSV